MSQINEYSRHKQTIEMGHSTSHRTRFHLSEKYIEVSYAIAARSEFRLRVREIIWDVAQPKEDPKSTRTHLAPWLAT